METKKTRSVFFILFLLMSFGLGTSCSDDEDDFSLDGPGFSVSDLAGTWTATSAIFSLNAEGPGQSIDIVEEGGSVTLVIQNNGRFTITISALGETPEISTGRLAFDEELLVVFFDDDPDDFDFFVIDFSGNNLSLQNNTSEFDFDGDGTDESASISLTLVRN
ncbi:MAG: hypothetical protein WBG90_08010 [Saonia sp.]